MRKLNFLLVFLYLLSGISVAQTQCGGTERWRVKVGTDPQVQQVMVNQSVAISLHDLIRLPEPVRPNDDVTRVVPDEAHVYKVRAYMLKYKLEQNDSDYHIVITDDTHQFTDHLGNAMGHSVIAEIPDPNCLAGKGGQFPGDSPFAAAITAVREFLDSRFPNAKKNGTFNNVDLPVEITAVGFFDRPHGQIGRATNNIELHPILRLCFLDGTAPQCSSDTLATTVVTPTPMPAGPLALQANAPFTWSLAMHGSGSAQVATISINMQSQGAATLQLNFYAGENIPADSYDPATKVAVKNLDQSMLAGMLGALTSSGTVTVSITSSGQPPQYAVEIQFASKAP